MTDPMFKIEGIHQAVSFRPRMAFEGYHVFDDGDSAVLIGPDTALDLRKAASAAAGQARPRETGGLLAGRVLRDAGGQYLVVSGFVEAEPGSGNRAAFYISPEATAGLREKSSRTYPMADVVGWWHSHPRPSSFSQTDLSTQSIWKQPTSLGLLVFAAGEPWAAAYVGPQAKKLSCQATSWPTGQPNAYARPDSPGENSRMITDAEQDQPVHTISDPPRRDAWQSMLQKRGLARLGVKIASYLVLILITSGIVLGAESRMSSRLNAEQRALSSRISSEQRQLAGEIGRGSAASRARVRISWSFVPATVPAAGHFECDLKISVLAGIVEWRLDGKPCASGLGVTIHVPQDQHALAITGGRPLRSGDLAVDKRQRQLTGRIHG